MDDLAVPQHHRSGAHRARRHPLLVALVTVGAVAVASAALLWALLAFDVLGVGDDLLEAGGVAPQPSTAASPAPSAGAPVAPEASVPPAESVAPAPSAEPSPEPAVPDRSLPVDVLNSTSTPGLAGGAAELLGDVGWEVGEVGNYDGDEIPTAVLYPEGDDPEAAAVAAATAAAVADDLGVGTPEASADVDGLTVVLGSDYEG